MISMLVASLDSLSAIVEEGGGDSSTVTEFLNQASESGNRITVTNFFLCYGDIGDTCQKGHQLCIPSAF